MNMFIKRHENYCDFSYWIWNKSVLFENMIQKMSESSKLITENGIILLYRLISCQRYFRHYVGSHLDMKYDEGFKKL